jgi:hypothetical protein
MRLHQALRRSPAMVVFMVAVASVLASPMLERRALAASATFVPPPPGSTSLTGGLDWRFSAYGSALGGSGLVARDLDGDGTVEIVATSQFSSYPGDYAWSITSRDPSGYGLKWVSPTYRDPIGALVVANVDSDPALEVLVAVGSRVLIYDGATHLLERTVAGLRNGMKAFAVADVDSDGANEIVSTDGVDLYVQDLATGNVEYRGIGLGGVSVAVGDVNGNASLEIVVANGNSTGYVIGGRQHRVIWSRADGFGLYVAIADVDHDGVNDIVSGFGSGIGIAVFDAVQKIEKGGLPVTYVNALIVVDTDGDGWPEVIYGDDTAVHVLDGSTLAERWAAPGPSGTSAIAWGDTDGDTVGELVYGAYVGPASELRVVDGATHTLEWSSVHVAGPLTVAFGDVDADGRVEAVSMSTDSGDYSGGGRWLVHDAGSHVLEYASGPVGPYSDVPHMLLANVDTDPQAEVIVAAADYPGDVVICFDGLTHTEQWRRSLQQGSSNLSVTSLAIGDVDGDGALEVAVATWGYAGAFVFVLDAETGAVEWQSFSLGSYGDSSFLRIANLGGANASIIVRQASSYSASDGRLSVVDAVAHTVSTVATPRLSALETADLDGNNVDEVIGGTEDGRLVTLDPWTGAISSVIASYGQRIDGLAARDLDGDGVVDYVFALANSVYVVSGADGHALWASDPLDDGGTPSIDVGRDDRLVVTTPGGAGGRFKIGVSTGVSGFAMFKLRRSSGP